MNNIISKLHLLILYKLLEKKIDKQQPIVNCIRLKDFGGNYWSPKEKHEIVSFRANLIEFRVLKCSFSGWDTVSQLSCLQLICDKSKLYFELDIIVPRREIKMKKSTDIEPKSLVGGEYPPYPPPLHI